MNNPFDVIICIIINVCESQGLVPGFPARSMPLLAHSTFSLESFPYSSKLRPLRLVLLLHYGIPAVETDGLGEGEHTGKALEVGDPRSAFSIIFLASSH